MKTVHSILSELQFCTEQIDKQQYKTIVWLLRKDTTFHFFGEGRSGLVAKMIAMRSMHSGKNVYVIGETISPAIRKNDVCILISGSAKTNAIRYIGKLASNIGATTFLVTANKEALTDDFFLNGLWINATTKKDLQNDTKTIQPLGNQFDQMAHIVLDAAIIDSTSDMTNMFKNHTNME